MADNKSKLVRERAEREVYSRVFSHIKGSTVRVLEPEGSNSDAIGYTSGGNTIHVAFDHRCMNGLNDKGKQAFRCGVAVHELMHQLLTDFVMTNRVIVQMPKTEQEVFKAIENYVEDARIEHFAYQFIGGYYLKCLEFAIQWSWKTAPPLEECETPFEQFLMACEHFGDMGLPKGHWTFPEAKEIFDKIVPLYYKATIETQPRRVLRLCKDIFEISRPLWEDEKELEKIMKKLAEEMAARGKNMNDGADSSSKASTRASEEEDGAGGGAASKNRKAVEREVSRREYERAQSQAGSGGGSGNGERIKCKDAKTAEEAREAANEAAEDARDAQDAADDAKQAAKEAREAANNAKGTPDEKGAEIEAGRSERAAERAQAAADRAKSAAEDAKTNADKAQSAKDSGDTKAEENAARQAGRDALRANAALKAAENANDIANGKTEASGAQGTPTAQDAAESANDAKDAANDAEAAAQKAEAKAKATAESKGADSEEAKAASENAKKAREAADNAKEAAGKASESAKSAQTASENGNDYGESTHARNASAAAKRAQREAAKAQRAADGVSNYTPGEQAEDAENRAYDASMIPDGDSFDSEYTDRAMHGATPDYDNCSDEISEQDYDFAPSEIDVEDHYISDDDYKSIETEINACIEALDRQDTEREMADSAPLPEYGITSAKIAASTSCLNVRVRVGDADSLQDTYERIVSVLRPGINSLFHRLRNIFMNDTEEKDFHSNGKLNTKRFYGDRITSRVFDKRRLPSDKEQCAIFIAIDESGSMSGSKSNVAKETAISLAEVFGKLNIPVYIMGFTADTSGYDAVHNHYITWRNTPYERLRLLDISARCNNFDGYSIRYATEILRRANAVHKLLIVISDGCPAARAYSGRDGIADTMDAIRNAKKQFDVLGVLIGNDSVKDIQNMYGNDFINVNKISDLFANIAKRIIHIVNKWE